MSMNKVRVLVVDDSALMRKLIPQMVETDQSIEVVGTAMDGTFCLRRSKSSDRTWSLSTCRCRE